MITVQVAKPQTQRQWVIQTQLYARDSQTLAACLTHLQATKRVEQTAYPHTTQRSGLQCLDHSIQAMTVLYQIELEIDTPLRLFDGSEHGPEELGTID